MTQILERKNTQIHCKNNLKFRYTRDFFTLTRNFQYVFHKLVPGNFSC